jgi:hypothetical protein
VPNWRVGQDGSKGFEVKNFLMRQPEVEEFDWDQQVPRSLLRPHVPPLLLPPSVCPPAHARLLRLSRHHHPSPPRCLLLYGGEAGHRHVVHHMHVVHVVPELPRGLCAASFHACIPLPYVVPKP